MKPKHIAHYIPSRSRKPLERPAYSRNTQKDLAKHNKYRNDGELPPQLLQALQDPERQHEHGGRRHEGSDGRDTVDGLVVDEEHRRPAAAPRARVRLLPEQAQGRLGPEHDVVLEPLAEDGFGSGQADELVRVLDELRLRRGDGATVVLEPRAEVPDVPGWCRTK